MTFALRTPEQIAPKDKCQLVPVGRLALCKGEGRGRENSRLIDAVKAHPLPPAFARVRRGKQSSPLQQGERRDKPDAIQSDNQRTLLRRGTRIKFVLPWRAKKGQHALASSSLGVSRELHLALFPQGPIATRARVAKLKNKYENEKQT